MKIVLYCKFPLLTLLTLLALPVSAQTDFDVFEASISDIQRALERGDITSVGLVEQYIARIDAYDQQGPALNSIIRINPAALALAKILDDERQRSGPRSQLHGVPIIVKDNYNTNAMPTTGGSVALAGFVPSVNATQVDKLEAAGAIVLAKSNLHEYAYGITTISSIAGQTRNPYDIRRVPGGSSGGTGAAVAASFAAVGMGSDTCGSIRIPSAFNNLIGLRPSKGLSSIFGVMPLSHTQDVAGPLARSAEDLAIVLDVVSGYDARDEATKILLTKTAPRFQEQLGSVAVKGLRLGKLSNYFSQADRETREVIEQTLAWFEEQGAEIVDIDDSSLAPLVARSGVIGHEFKVDLNQYLSMFSGSNSLSLNDIVDLGLYHEAVAGALTRSRASVLNEDSYTQALQARSELRLALEQIFDEQDLDVMVYPPIAATPVYIGESQPGNNCSLSANSGLPALSMPAGVTASGLPVGMELLARFFDDAQLLAIAYEYEQAQQPRFAPSVTPALVEGLAPASNSTEVTIREGKVALDFSFTYDVTKNELAYEVSTNTSNDTEIYAVTLFIDEEEVIGLNDPVVVNLMGPSSTSSSGSYFMSPQFRRAFTEGRVFLKLFAASLPNVGFAKALN